jgi:hypothetical protein
MGTPIRMPEQDRLRSSVRCAWATSSPTPCNRDTLHTRHQAGRKRLSAIRGTTSSRKGNAHVDPIQTRCEAYEVA